MNKKIQHVHKMSSLSRLHFFPASKGSTFFTVHRTTDCTARMVERQEALAASVNELKILYSHPGKSLIPDVQDTPRRCPQHSIDTHLKQSRLHTNYTATVLLFLLRAEGPTSHDNLNAFLFFFGFLVCHTALLVPPSRCLKLRYSWPATKSCST